jgi:hypothetical protein
MQKLNDLDVRLWLGNTGNFDIDDCIDLIVQIANGDYQADQLKQDILFNKDMLGDYFKNPHQDSKETL